MSRTQRALLAASLSAVSLSILTLPATSFAAGSAAPAPTEYVVRNGDFLAGIAAKVGVALPDLLTANHLTSKSLILPGEKLVVPASAVASTPPAPAAPAAPTAGAVVYTVKNGDFLMGIAALYKVTLADLLAVNHLTTTSMINPGRQLALPANAVAPAAPPAAAPAAAAPAITYTVKSGDSLSRIASQFKVKLPDLLALNKFTASSLILPGAKLALPAGAVQPSAGVTSSPVVQAAPGPAGIVVGFAYAQLGKPYRFFTAGPNTFDCSGLVMAAFAQIGIQMIHHAASQASYGTAVDIWSTPIKAGDLIFMGKQGGAITHVGIAVDATQWIHAPAPGDVVRLSPIPPKGIITTVRRVIP
jgi:LysM repeat protein